MKIENFKSKKFDFTGSNRRKGEIVCKESKKSKNPSKVVLKVSEAEFYQVKFDEQCGQEHGLRCDFVVYLGDKSVVLFVEIKGNDIVHAYEQIKNSRKLLTESFSNSKQHCAIVYCGTPKNSVSFSDLKIEAKKDKFKELFIKSNLISLKYENSEIQHDR